MSPFAHLHLHTEFSALDGMTRLSDLFTHVASLGQDAVAVTDHGTLGGMWRAQQEADKAGVRLIPGLELYLAYGSRFDPGAVEVPVDGSDAGDMTGKTRPRRYMHLTVLATTPEGWRNLVRVRNATEHTKVKHGSKKYPLADYDLLAEHADGLVVLTGCLGGPVLGPLSRGDEVSARAGIEALVAAVGRDNVFVEVMEHGIDAETAVLPRLADIAAEYGLPLVATNDSHHLLETDRDAHDAWLALQTQSKVADQKRYRFHGDGYHVRSEAEMRALRPEPWWQDAVTNTSLVASRVTGRLLPKAEAMLPVFPTPDGFATNLDFYVTRVREGAERRYGSPLPQQVRDRLNHELGVIRNPVPGNPELNFIDYMLMVAEMIDWEHQQGGLTGAGRGSAAGSIHAYALGITNIDPLEHNLLFERFLEPGRADWPDIDTDFQKSRRDAVLDHLRQFWGKRRVVLIGSVPMSKAKRAIRDAARVLGVSMTVSDELAKAVPAGDVTLTQLLSGTNPAGVELIRALDRLGHDASKTIDLACKFEGTAAGIGVHACGVVVADRDLTDLIPLRIHPDTGWPVTEWDSKDVESFGLVKLDVLALRNLDIAAAAIDTIDSAQPGTVTFDSIPDGSDLTDSRVQSAWRLLKEGRTAGVFQMESPAMANLAQDVRPDTVGDLSAVIALFRPGPIASGMPGMYARRKSGVDSIEYSWLTTDPTEERWLDTVLGETFGLCVYQEQMMRLGTVVAGFDAKERSKLRKAVGKKNKIMMAEVGEELIARAGIEYRDDDGNIYSPAFSASTAERVFEAIKGAAEYAFNKSHSAAYARLAWQTAYLKANWPAPFGAAILAATDSDEKRVEAVRALTGEGVVVLPPDVNVSGVNTAAEGVSAVRLGLSEVKGVGQAGALIVAARGASGRGFTDLHDFTVRVRNGSGDPTMLSSTAVTALIEAGAFDKFGPRLGLTMVARTSKQHALTPPDMEWGVVERSSRQRERLLVGLGESPLKHFQQQLREWNTWGVPTPVNAIPESNGANTITLGVLGSFTKRSYAGGTMANLTLEGSAGSVNGVMWDRVVETVRSTTGFPPVGSLVGVTGRVRVRELEREDEDGNTSTVMHRELTISGLQPIPVDDPVRGMLAEDVTVPDFRRPAVAEEPPAVVFAGVVEATSVATGDGATSAAAVVVAAPVATEVAEPVPVLTGLVEAAAVEMPTATTFVDTPATMPVLVVPFGGRKIADDGGAGATVVAAVNALLADRPLPGWQCEPALSPVVDAPYVIRNPAGTPVATVAVR